MPELDKLGRSEGPMVGPKPGDGAVIHHSSGEEDFDGLPGDALPPKKGGDATNQPALAQKAADPAR